MGRHRPKSDGATQGYQNLFGQRIWKSDRHGNGWNRKFSKETKELLIKRYLSGERIHLLAEEFHSEVQCIIRALGQFYDHNLPQSRKPASKRYCPPPRTKKEKPKHTLSIRPGFLITLSPILGFQDQHEAAGGLVDIAIKNESAGIEKQFIFFFLGYSLEPSHGVSK